MATTSPYLAHLSADVTDAVITVRVAPEHLNRGGRVHGGLLASMLDSIMGHTVGENIPGGVGTATVSLTVSFLEPAFLGDELRATATLIRRGSSLVTAEGTVTREADGTRIAQALGTFTVTKQRPHGR